jgi:photolyase PhrII
MHHGVRGHENPALEASVHFARQLDLPLLVYHAVCEDYPYASDRHHAFILQGARDVDREMSDLGIRYVFHLQREQHRGPHLRDLTRRAALLVTEEMPVEPISSWLDRLRSTTRTPIAAIDTACIVTPALVGKSFTRAFEFRDSTKLHLERCLARSQQTQLLNCKSFDGDLPFEPIDLQNCDFRNLIGACRIDHTIAPVADTPGGSRSGYARWEKFKETGLRDYAKRRCDAAEHRGVSRMSAYLHFGMVSPFRVAREAAQVDASKFLDELLVWRELAFHFCYFNRDLLDSLDAVPEWAQQSMADHRNDLREASCSWETLARGKTDNRLWDACQRSLLKHGELHNNLRMTWGKAFLNWTDSPERALRMATDLNHRYALDGRDPSSYGGLLWCFGQFDRPFHPEQPIYGTVRTRPLDEHASRIDMPRYLRVADRPICDAAPSVAIIGAGIAGLVAARTLSDHGLSVEIFEKSRGVGGRMATRRNEVGLNFDHGAQYFTARDERFTRHVQSWIHEGIAEPWHGRIVQICNGTIVAKKNDTPRYVAVPGMNAIARQLASGLSLSLNCKIDNIDSIQTGPSQRWRLIDDTGTSRGDFDCVIINCPPPQAEPLLRPHSPMAQTISSIEMLPCWASMIQLPDQCVLPFDAAFVDESPLSWICRNDSKPGRSPSDGPCWVLHAASQWSQERLEMDPAEVEQRMLEAFFDATGVSPDMVRRCGTHRWRYAVPKSVLAESCIWDSTTRLGACGDWCGGPRVEGAFLSGAAMSGAVLRDVTIDRRASRPEFQTEMLF